MHGLQIIVNTVDIATAPVAVAPVSGKPSRADVIAALEKLPAETPEEVKTESVAPPVEAAADSVAPVEDIDPADEKPAAEVEAKPDEHDAETTKRLSVVQKAEKRSREAIAEAKRAAADEVQSERARLTREFAPHIESAKAYAAAKEQARTNPVALLRSLGVSDEDMDYVARQVYASSSAAAADPKNSAAAAQARRERESDSELARLRKTVEDMQTGQTQREQQAQASAAAQNYIASVAKAVSDETPLVAKLLEKSPQKAHERIATMTNMMLERDREVPDAADVLAAVEAERRAELEELGIDPTTITKAKPTAPVVKSKTLDPAASPGAKAPAAAPRESAEERRVRLERDMPWR